MTCCFIGHRKIEDEEELKKRLREILLDLAENGTTNFIFGDHSAFDRLCYEMVTELKEKYPAIKRIHFRKDYEEADEYTMRFLISGYEESVCPKGVGIAGRAGYVERNMAMIKQSDLCVFYYNKNYRPPRRKYARAMSDYQPNSGTATAYNYAVKTGKKIYNVF